MLHRISRPSPVAGGDSVYRVGVFLAAEGAPHSGAYFHSVHPPPGGPLGGGQPRIRPPPPLPPPPPPPAQKTHPNPRAQKGPGPATTKCQRGEASQDGG